MKFLAVEDHRFRIANRSGSILQHRYDAEVVF